ncbi:unnamed protein product [Spirodela intermedia]|uniref:Protein kinase domain-containing protein n=1 Tax=Spirodela intermedia TaxID=51605 RepID=A0A7I8JKE8_SPIIN|nr:unnamed protein product [Spirodela intermedia]CAA6669922.1 unnamed protein product [Spirodela intermedia]
MGSNSTAAASSSSSSSSLVKEYFLNVSSTVIWVQFAPSPGCFAFVNAIEVVPILDGLFFDPVTRTMYRVNMGDREVKAERDRGLWRSWETDIKYMFSSLAAKTISNSSNITYADGNRTSIAPLPVYEDARTMVNDDVVEKRFNVTWKFYVDPGFDYLVRLHFCELVYDTENQRVFRIYLNFRNAADNYDILAKAGGKGRAYCQDFVDSAPEEMTIWLQLGQDATTGAQDTDVLLNGLEIFKLSRKGNLAFVPEKTTAGAVGPPGGRPKRGGNQWVPIAAGVASTAAAVIVCAAVVFFLCARARTRRGKAPPQVKGGNPPPVWRPLVLNGALASAAAAGDAQGAAKAPNSNGASNRTGRRFAVADIRAATRNFDEALVIGTGGFGKVYKGELEDGRPVAVKRAHPQSEQGLAEFETEIAMLSKLRHRHLVSMIGYCDEQQEMILVYEYMANGTLRSHLYGSGGGGELRAPLPWRCRLQICIGAARGLHYLHTGADRGGIIHRDVKTTNILLDEDLVAKMADFGLSKDGPALDCTHVSTAYFRRQQLTQKSDVYSFGVVLFEVVCARPVINPALPKDQINLAEWAARWQRQGALAASLGKFGEIALKCLADEGRCRPTIGEVLWHLEYVLQLHDTSQRSLLFDPSPPDDALPGTMAAPLGSSFPDDPQPHHQQNRADDDSAAAAGDDTPPLPSSGA